MDINIPQYHVLDKKDKFLSENVWEISVPQIDSIEWSAFLSESLSKASYDELVYPPADPLKFMKTVKSYNPFRNRYSFILNNHIKKTLNTWKSSLASQGTLEYKLQVISERLNCIICLYGRDMTLHRYIRAIPGTSSTFNVILFVSAEGKIRNSFGLPESSCEKWRENALKYILSKTRIPRDNFKSIWEIVKNKENILIAILNSDKKDIIEYLCDSPSLLAKLREAGFQADPKVKDRNELSAFYYALKSGNHSLCISLYNLAIQCCSETGGSIRDPNNTVIHNLLNLKESVNSALSVASIMNKGHENHEKIKDIGATLLYLINLNIEIDKEILKFQSKENPEKSDEFLVKLALDQMISVLGIYLNHSSSLPGLTESSDSPTQRYIKYKYYYDVVDVEISFLFFYNIYMLKRKLKLSNKNDYTEVESAFFISLLSYVIFNRKVKTTEYFRNLCTISDRNTYQIPLTLRETVLQKIELFLNILKNTHISHRDLREEVSTEEFDLQLQPYPEIKEYLLINRLTNYIKSALKIKKWNRESVFVIERVLQVIGEFMKTEPRNDFCFKWCLSLYMPKHVREVLHSLRNELSHLNAHAFSRKIEVEKNFTLFSSIQKDIVIIDKYLKPLLHISTLRIVIYIKELLEKALKLMNGSGYYEDAFKSKIPLMIQSIIDIEHEYSEISSSDNFLIVFRILLNHFELELNEKQSNLQNDESGVTIIKNMLRPLSSIIKLEISKIKQENLKSEKLKLNSLQTISNISEKCYDLNIFLELMDTVRSLISKCNFFLSQYKATQNFSNLEDVHNIKIFFQHLKIPSFITEEDKCNVIKHCEIKIRDDLKRRETIFLSLFNENSFTLQEEELSKCKIMYFSNRKWKLLMKYYNERNLQQTIRMLNEIKDPVAEMEKILQKNFVKKQDFERLSKIILLPEDLHEKFQNLTIGTRKKIGGNRLLHLLDRITHLKKMLIDNDNETLELWNNFNIKNQFLQDKIADQIISRYMGNLDVQHATETLVFDCMNLFKEDKKSESPWRKSSKLYKGVNLRNIMAHEDVIIQNLCEWFDPSDLPENILGIVIELLKDRELIEGILQFHDYKRVNNKEKIYLVNRQSCFKLKEFYKGETININSDICLKYIKLLPNLKKKPSI